MSFLTVLVVLFFYRNWGGDNPVRQHVDSEAYFKRMDGIAMPAPWRFWFRVGLPVLVVWFIAESVEHWLQGVVWLLLSLGVVIYCIDLTDVETEFYEYKQKLQAVSGEEDLADIVQMQEEFQTDHFHSMFQGIVPTLFWFLLLGPAGALAYFLTLQYLNRMPEGDEEEALVDQIVHWLEWIPVRITGLLFCFTGNFGPTFDYWVGQLFDVNESSSTHLSAMVGLAADVTEDHDDDVLGFARFAEAHVDEMRYLCDRALFGWLGVAALVTILHG